MNYPAYGHGSLHRLPATLPLASPYTSLDFKAIVHAYSLNWTGASSPDLSSSHEQYNHCVPLFYCSSMHSVTSKFLLVLQAGPRL